MDKLFKKEILIEMWINKISKEAMIDEIVDSGSLEKILELYSEEVFSIGGIQYEY